MTAAAARRRIDALLIRYLRLPRGTALDGSQEIRAFGAADWRVIDLGIAVATEFGVELSADAALALRTVGEWRALVDHCSD